MSVGRKYHLKNVVQIKKNSIYFKGKASNVYGKKLICKIGTMEKQEEEKIFDYSRGKGKLA